MAQHPTAAGKSSFGLIDVETFFSTLHLRSGTVLLDAACGVGNYTIEIARRMPADGMIHALDLWAGGIAELRLRAADLGLSNIDTAVCDLSDAIPLGNASVDICLLATVLHDLIQDGTHRAALTEIVRVLKPAGRLAVVEFKKIPGPPGPPEGIRLAPDALAAVLSPFGFRCDETLELGPAVYFCDFVSAGE